MLLNLIMLSAMSFGFGLLFGITLMVAYYYRKISRST